VRILEARIVGENHLRLTAAGDDGARLKAIGFRMAGGPLGEALLAATPQRRLWLAGKVKRDDWNGRGQAELHLDDAAWADL
jgi:single-stranded-DNA-specific exonuclease